MARESWLPSLRNPSRSGDPFTVLRKEIDDLFSSFGGMVAEPFKGTTLERFEPSIDVSETDKELKVTAELPGLTEKDVEVTLVDNVLTIKGEKKQESEQKEEKEGRVYHRVERSYGSFQRALRLPYDIEPDKVAAEVKSGVLTVVVPKPQAAQRQAKRIEIKPAG
jgi:HSP20 family protein